MTTQKRAIRWCECAFFFAVRCVLVTVSVVLGVVHVSKEHHQRMVLNWKQSNVQQLLSKCF